MHSSYNLIKENAVLSKDTKVIKTEFKMDIQAHELQDNNDQETPQGITYEEAQTFIKNYEKIGKNIIEDAKLQKNKIIIEATEKSAIIEREAYEKGYAQGMENGQEDGKKQAFDIVIPEATKKAEEMIARAESTLKSALADYAAYMESKKSEIIELSITIAQQILKREILNKSGLNSLVDEAIKLSKNSENIVVKCNSKHISDLQKEIPVWKSVNNIKGEIFILADDNMECGNAVIEKETGKIEVGIDIGLEKIKQAIL